MNEDEEKQKQIDQAREIFTLFATGIVIVARCIGGANSGPQSLVDSSESVAKAFVAKASDDIVLEIAK